MSPRPIDLDRVRSALARLDALAAEHPELLEGDAPERLAAHLEGLEDDAPEETPEESADGAEKGDDARPASR